MAKSRKEKIMEMIDTLKEENIRLELARDWRKEQKENPETKKEIDAAEFTIKKNDQFIEFLNKQLLLCA